MDSDSEPATSAHPYRKNANEVLYDSRAPSVRICGFLRSMQVVIGPALWQNAEYGRLSGQAVQIRQISRSLSALSVELAIAKKKGFKLHIAFRWYAADDWPSYLGAVCTIIYRLKAHGFLVTSSQAYGQTINILCNEENRICRARRFGETVWHLKEDRDCFDCS
jgi:hypothetical protein